MMDCTRLARGRLVLVLFALYFLPGNQAGVQVAYGSQLVRPSVANVEEHYSERSALQHRSTPWTKTRAANLPGVPLALHTPSLHPTPPLHRRHVLAVHQDAVEDEEMSSPAVDPAMAVFGTRARQAAVQAGQLGDQPQQQQERDTAGGSSKVEEVAARLQSTASSKSHQDAINLAVAAAAPQNGHIKHE